MRISGAHCYKFISKERDRVVLNELDLSGTVTQMYIMNLMKLEEEKVRY